MPESPAHHRYPELDLLRTTAILGMIVYHTAYDLAEFYAWDFNPLSGGWWFFARSVAILFLLVSGASNTIANARAHATEGMQAMWKRTLERTLQIGAAALLVTVITYVVDPAIYIRFGILHCIALSVFLLPLFRYFRLWNLFFGAGIIALGNAIAGMTTNTSLLLPLGILPRNFSSLDYFPLLPWFGVVLIGSAIADFVYIKQGFQGIPFSHIQRTKLGALGNAINRHALIIYLVHQPIILLILMLILGKPTM